MEYRVASPASVELREVSKHYGGLRAVDRLSATARAGSILGIAGPNGAGKTTLFDVICGLSEATSGDVMLAGESVSHLSVHQRCHRGMARTFQRPTVGADLTVAENVAVGAHFGRAEDHWTGVPDDKSELVDWCLSCVGLEADSKRNAGLLGVYDKKRLMLASALALGPRALLLDEPFGGLNDVEIDAMIDQIQRIAEIGVTIVCIEHVMRALVQLADHVIVMEQGRLLFEGTPGEMLSDQKVIEIYLGQAGGKR